MEDEDVGTYSSVNLIKSASDTPTTSSARKNKKTKSSKSSVNVASTSFQAQRDFDNYSEGQSVEVVPKKKSELPKSCNCGPDFYSRVLGPTADETILTGLQTVIDLCNKLRSCGDEEDEEPEREQNIPERDTNVSDRTLKDSRSQTAYRVVSAGFQVKPSATSAAAQTLPFPEMVSEILQTVGFTPEMVSKIMQTSLIEIAQSDIAEQTEPLKQISLASLFMQTSNPSLKSNAMQTTYPDLKSGLNQTSTSLLPTIYELPTPVATDTAETQYERQRSYSKETMSELPRSVSRQTSSDLVRSLNKQTMSDSEKGSMLLEPTPDEESKSFIDQAIQGDEHKCISPPEPPPESVTCKCCKCSSSSSSLRKKSKTSQEKKKHCICGAKTRSKCKCGPVGGKKSSLSMHGEQQPPLQVKYAITRISKFKDFTTFEVLKSTRSEPKHMPKSIEGVFVLKKRNGNSSGDSRLSIEEPTDVVSSNEIKSSSYKTKSGSRSNGTKSMSYRSDAKCVEV